MRLKLKTSADLVKYTCKRNKEHDGREATIDLEVNVRKEDASKWGEDFEALAFATMRVMGPAENDDDDEGDSVGFLVDTIKPGKRLVMELHELVLEGSKLEAQPELRAIRTVDGKARVTACLRIPVPVEKRVLVQVLTEKVGQVIKVEFEPTQAQFEFTRKAGAAAQTVAQAVHTAVIEDPDAAQRAVAAAEMQ